MSLKSEIPPYVDGNNLVAPNLIVPGGSSPKGSDNGPLYTSEYYIMLSKLGQLESQDLIDFQNRIGQCINSGGMLCRVPVGQNDGQEQVDDYYGVLSACMVLRNTHIPRQFLWATIKNKGSLDTVNPGNWQWDAVMIRQPQLLACMIAAAFPSWKNPLHILLRKLFFPFFAYSAIILAISCVGTDSSNTDSRLLGWHLWQCLKGVSPLCWLAGKLFRNRLIGDYGPTMMQAVAAIYFKDGHPFQRYWVTE